jgi:hypothetical protein
MTKDRRKAMRPGYLYFRCLSHYADYAGPQVLLLPPIYLLLGVLGSLIGKIRTFAGATIPVLQVPLPRPPPPPSHAVQVHIHTYLR